LQTGTFGPEKAGILSASSRCVFFPSREGLLSVPNEEALLNPPGFDGAVPPGAAAAAWYPGDVDGTPGAVDLAPCGGVERKPVPEGGPCQELEGDLELELVSL